MIRLAMELPTCALERWSETYTDLDFVLAHKVLEDNAYAEFFRRRSPKRELILDNSYHELGVPMSMKDLSEAANRVQATFVIAPDKTGDLPFTSMAYAEARLAMPQRKLAVVYVPTDAQTPDEHEQFLISVRDADMLCCTFKNPKRFEHYKNNVYTKMWHRVHLLGCAELAEISLWALYAHLHPHSISLDTGKPLKWALRGEKLDELVSVRFDAKSTEAGAPSDVSQKLLDTPESEFTEDVTKLFEHNVRILRGYLR